MAEALEVNVAVEGDVEPFVASLETLKMEAEQALSEAPPRAVTIKATLVKWSVALLGITAITTVAASVPGLIYVKTWKTELYLIGFYGPLAFGLFALFWSARKGLQALGKVFRKSHLNLREVKYKASRALKRLTRAGATPNRAMVNRLMLLLGLVNRDLLPVQAPSYTIDGMGYSELPEETPEEFVSAHSSGLLVVFVVAFLVLISLGSFAIRIIFGRTH